MKASNTMIHYTGETGPEDFNGVVRETSLEEFLNGSEKFSVCSFPATPQEFIASMMSRNTYRGNKFLRFIQLLRVMTASYHLYSGDETVARARSRIGQGGYNLALNNCEHFAVWCKTGVKDSSQVDNVLEALAKLFT